MLVWGLSKKVAQTIFAIANILTNSRVNSWMCVFAHFFSLGVVPSQFIEVSSIVAVLSLFLRHDIARCYFVYFLIILHYRDEHPRVRYAACNALGQMSTDFQPNLQKAYHDTVSAYSRTSITAFSYMMHWAYRLGGVLMVTTKSSALKPT